MTSGLKREERIGLGIAAGLHVALVLAFLLQPKSREAIEPVERMTVNLASDVGMEATAPEPVPESRAAIAPTLSDEPAPVAEPAPAIAQPQPKPVPQPKISRPAPAKPLTPPDTRDRRRPDKQSAAPPKPVKKGGGDLVGKDFLAGMGDSTKADETRMPASKIGTAEKSALVQAIGRQIKPHWQPPSGPDVDQIVTVLRFRLNPDGSLNGRPVVLRQSGINDANRTQAGRHGEQAIRAVQLAAPFKGLPDKYYDAWKLVSPFSFDWKLAQ